MTAKNLISVEWLESRDQGNINKVNIKHVVEPGVEDISVGAIVKVKFGNKIYSAKVLDLLSWKPGKRKSRKRPAKENVSFLEIKIRGKPPTNLIMLHLISIS